MSGERIAYVMSLSAVDESNGGPAVDGLDAWWVCTKPHCTWFSSEKAARDEHSATCSGQSEIPF